MVLCKKKTKNFQKKKIGSKCSKLKMKPFTEHCTRLMTFLLFTHKYYCFMYLKTECVLIRYYIIVCTYMYIGQCTFTITLSLLQVKAEFTAPSSDLVSDILTEDENR